MTNFRNVGDATPVAYVVKNKQRVKQYDGTVYLKNKETFELELWNPTQFKVLAKIELNGISIGSGIVLRPAERVFLDRYINEAKKFLFETYEVEGEYKEVLKAIEKNGLVSVKFFKEDTYIPTIQLGDTYIYNGGSGNNPFKYNQFNTCENNGLIGGSSSANCFYSSEVGSSVSMDGILTTSASTTKLSGGQSTNSLRKDSIETGRIEKGEKSDQTFDYDNSKFEFIHSWKSEWKLLPESRKAVVAEDLVLYCGNCKSKRKKDSHKFCPYCGEAY